MTVSAAATLNDRIQGGPGLRILREFATNSGIFPAFHVIRIITTLGFADFVSDPANFAILLAGAAQAVFLGMRSRYQWWQRALGNLIAPLLYTILDLILEGPAEYASAPYHWVFWIYAGFMAFLYALENLIPALRTALIIVISLWRVTLFPALYVLSELGKEFAQFTWPSFVDYWQASPGHSFILLAALLFGLLLGLSEAQVSRFTEVLQRIATRLKQVSEWSLDSDLLEESIHDQGVLSQRRAERAILFMDIRGFTAWSESRDPETVVGMLNQFYELAERIVMAGGGHKPHFIADEVMTWFEDPQAAVETARRLKRETSDLLRHFELASGAGLHLGQVVEGLMGSSTTRNYNIIGDAVNTTARLCAAAHPGEALISGELAERLALVKELGAPRSIEAKGKQELLTVYPL